MNDLAAFDDSLRYNAPTAVAHPQDERLPAQTGTRLHFQIENPAGPLACRNGQCRLLTGPAVRSILPLLRRVPAAAEALVDQCIEE